VTFLLLAEQAQQRNGGRVSRFSSSDEEPPFGDETGSAPEWSGQHIYDLARGLIRPRPVIRYQEVCDPSRPILSAMVPFPPGVQTPLSRLGSKLLTVWRYADFGFGSTDVSELNIDVEGMYWSPVTGSVQADHFPGFEIRLSHSYYLPDDDYDPNGQPTKYPLSGLDAEFGRNPLSLQTDPPRIVHPRQRGYTLRPEDAFRSSSGTILVPWPMNRDLPVSEQRTFTWRDSAIYDRAAPDGGGVDLGVLINLFGIGIENLMAPEKVTTLGLPLLLDFRCYPDDTALGLNPLSLLLANNRISQPNFRAFSTGGLDQTGQVVRVDPDAETHANGGFNPNSMPPGAATLGVDNSFYVGGADFLTRVSRSISIWFEATGSAAPKYRSAIFEPLPAQQPVGTSLLLAFRGARVAEPAAVRADASRLDLWGEYYDDPAVSRSDPNLQMLLLDGGRWHEDIVDIEGAPYYQVRVTFVANKESGLVSELSALAVAWED
jgi:hypothetical protein